MTVNWIGSPDCLEVQYVHGPRGRHAGNFGQVGDLKESSTDTGAHESLRFVWIQAVSQFLKPSPTPHGGDLQFDCIMCQCLTPTPPHLCPDSKYAAYFRTATRATFWPRSACAQVPWHKEVAEL
jgi:hypothetical protein